ncbi:Gp86 [Mycolicibacterium canariasense]|uniref:Gp86 n=1 Tax=Mycolicibacterium canariasense TaxID=228230 RepID=A0A100WJ44_MYCCR|nr:hypothetical protein [Mycolicibacterium canariasense]MCV7210188.1 hypothetical protein [Mycolicibacterium canariasense]ORV14584.1 hypothetical protein AWB94_04280 [Mycolicibacterium canariasense]GAS98844.1 Gp86 [Mycolicibacterium canariasense]
MSVYVDVQVNNDPITSVGITRTTSAGSAPDSVNTYRWVVYREQGRKTVGFVEHRYGDGALALTHKVLGAIVENDRLQRMGDR